MRELEGKWPHYAEDEVEAAAAVLRSGRVNYWTGPEAKNFESAYADHCGKRYGISLANGTLALELALRAFAVGPGDEVVVTPRSYFASAACVIAVGARPIFADVDPLSGNLTAATIEAVLTPRTKAVIVVHLGGWPADMAPIMALAESRGFRVIEDCAQAHGALDRGKVVGGIGHAGAFSFCQDKIISTGGEGGMLVLSDEQAFKRAWSYKDCGKDFDAVFAEAHPPGFRWVHHHFGSNWRMPGTLAAIGLRQLQKLPDWRDAREKNALIIVGGLQPLGILEFPTPPAESRHAWYRLYGYFDPARLRSGWSQGRIVGEMALRGVLCFTGSCGEIYRERAFVDALLQPPATLVNAERLSASSLAFAVHPTLTATDLDYIVGGATELLRMAFR